MKNDCNDFAMRNEWMEGRHKKEHYNLHLKERESSRMTKNETVQLGTGGI
jgi:hypothetical protein